MTVMNSLLIPARRVALLTILATGLAACATNISPDRYDGYAVGQVNRAERGEIVNSRWVEITRSNQGIGTATGVAAGAAAGSTVGNGAEGVLGAIGGALLGGLIGNSVDKSVNQKSGFEYLVRTEGGDMVTLVQADKRPIPDGAPVLIVYNRDMTRLVLDESRIEFGAAAVVESELDENGQYRGRITSTSDPEGQ